MQFEATSTFRPLNKEEVARLPARTAVVAKNGKFERFKTTTKYDSTAKNPEYLS